MSVFDLVNELRGRGVEFRVQGNNVVVDAPKGVVHPNEVSALRSQKSQIVRLLANDGPPYSPCSTCGGRLFWADARELPDHASWRCEHCKPPPPDLSRHACSLPPQGLRS